jgi:hypothetical protein
MVTLSKGCWLTSQRLGVRFPVTPRILSDTCRLSRETRLDDCVGWYCRGRKGSTRIAQSATKHITTPAIREAELPGETRSRGIQAYETTTGFLLTYTAWSSHWSSDHFDRLQRTCVPTNGYSTTVRQGSPWLLSMDHMLYMSTNTPMSL